jgi:hypothetical protein
VIDEMLVRLNDFDALVVRLITSLLCKLFNQVVKNVALKSVEIWPFIVRVFQANVDRFL